MALLIKNTGLFAPNEILLVTNKSSFIQFGYQNTHKYTNTKVIGTFYISLHIRFNH